MTEIALPPRRVLATRETAWAQRLARMLGEAGATPNVVSVAGVVWSLAACAAFFVAGSLEGTSRAIVLLAAAASIQLRLLCNLLDGMLAIEQGLKSPLGDLYNEIPDRLADIAILVGAGLAVNPALGCAAAIAALLTAYVRVLGGSLGLTQHFTGPMAKQHRMFVITVATLWSAVEAVAGVPARGLALGLVVVTVGAVATIWRRVVLIANELRAP